jgi:hypothetical protein
MAKHKLKASLTTEQLAEHLVGEIKSWTPKQKAETRAAIRKSAKLSSLAGRAQHLHGLAFAAQQIAREEAHFKDAIKFFEEMKSENVRYKV